MIIGARVVARIQRFFDRSSDRFVDTDSQRIDMLTANREQGAISQSDGHSIPPNYLPPGVDERKPRK